jgi:uncharacterized membrane protein YvbJ
MTCPNCKNPIQHDSAECEWCGNKIISDIQSVNPVISKNNNKSFKYILYLAIVVVSAILTMNSDDVPFVFIVLGGIVIFEILNYFRKKN